MIDSFVRVHLRSFVRAVVRACVRACVRAFVRAFVCLFVRARWEALSRALVHNGFEIIVCTVLLRCVDVFAGAARTGSVAMIQLNDHVVSVDGKVQVVETFGKLCVAGRLALGELVVVAGVRVLDLLSNDQLLCILLCSSSSWWVRIVLRCVALRCVALLFVCWGGVGCCVVRRSSIGLMWTTLSSRRRWRPGRRR